MFALFYTITLKSLLFILLLPVNFYVISQGAVDLYLILQLQNIRLLSFNNNFQGGNLWNVYETEDIPDRNKLWLLTTLASFTILVTAVLWMLWWDLSRENLFLGVYLADKLYLLDIRDLTAYRRSPCSLQSMTEITWVLWDSSWDCKFPRISLQFSPALLYLPLPFYKSQICIVFWKFSWPKTASFPFIYKSFTPNKYLACIILSASIFGEPNLTYLLCSYFLLLYVSIPLKTNKQMKTKGKL